MAYPTPPGARIAYDLDGTIAFVSGKSPATGGPAQVAPVALKYLNADSPKNMIVTTDYWGTQNFGADNDHAPVGAWIALRFPSAMRLRAVSFAALWGVSSTMSRTFWLLMELETSDDSTNGEDGTWHSLQTYPDMSNNGDFSWGFDYLLSSNALTGAEYGSAYVDGREVPYTGLGPLSVTPQFRKSRADSGIGWRALAGSATRQVTWLRARTLGTGYSTAFNYPTVDEVGAGLKLHLYGEPDTSASEDRLQFVDSGGVYKPFFDWGNVQAGDIDFQTFKVENLSSTLTATGIVVSVSASNPDPASHPYTSVELSPDGTTWASTLALSDLAPGITSAAIQLRLTTPNVVGNWGPRLVVEVEEWT